VITVLFWGLVFRSFLSRKGMLRRNMYATAPRAKLGFRVTSVLVSNTSRLLCDVCLGE
jgi:hypothetical protein